MHFFIDLIIERDRLDMMTVRLNAAGFVTPRDTKGARWRAQNECKNVKICSEVEAPGKNVAIH